MPAVNKTSPNGGVLSYRTITEGYFPATSATAAAAVALLSARDLHLADQECSENLDLSPFRNLDLLDPLMDWPSSRRSRWR